MVAGSGQEAVANARAIKSGYSGMCQKFTRVSWEVGSLYGSAIDAWNGAKEKHPGDRTPPVGAPCYYRGGNYGHAVVSIGDGRIRSTDCYRGGQISEVPLSWPETSWGYEYLGWTGDINAVDLPLTDGGQRPEPEEEDMPYTEWPKKDRQALCDDVVEALLGRDLYDQDEDRDVTVARALRVAENAGNATLEGQ